MQETHDVPPTRLASEMVNVIGPLDQITLIFYIQLTHSFPGR